MLRAKARGISLFACLPVGPDDLILGVHRATEGSDGLAPQSLRRVGQHRTFLQNLLENPVQVILYSLIVGLILYFSISPFFLDD